MNKLSHCQPTKRCQSRANGRIYLYVESDEDDGGYLCFWARISRHGYKCEKIGMYAPRLKIQKYVPWDCCIRSFYKWVESARYLGVYLVSSTNFKCSFSHNKAGFFKAFNSIYGKIGRSSSEEVIFELIKSKCLPVLMYRLDACPTNSADRQSLQLTVNKIIYKIFGAMAKDSYSEISEYFGTYRGAVK